MEHRFVTRSNGFVNAIVMSRQRLIDCNAEEIMDELLHKQNKNSEVNLTKPDLPLEYIRWVESNDISSANLRNIDK